jgi:hypothetical protein
MQLFDSVEFLCHKCVLGCICQYMDEDRSNQRNQYFSLMYVRNTLDKPAYIRRTSKYDSPDKCLSDS